jgi:hypothetical protein
MRSKCTFSKKKVQKFSKFVKSLSMLLEIFYSWNISCA